MAVQLLRRQAWVPDDLKAKVKAWTPQTDLGKLIHESFAYLPPDLAAELLDKIMASVIMTSSLSVVHLHGPQSDRFGAKDDYGIVSRKVITTAGVTALALTFNNVTMLAFKFHALGTNTLPVEGASDTTLGTELTTQYASSGIRATGSVANSTNTFTTVGTNTLSAGATINEHGVFSQAASGGTLWDRSLTGAQTLSTGDGLQATYVLTLVAGG